MSSPEPFLGRAPLLVLVLPPGVDEMIEGSGTLTGPEVVEDGGLVDVATDTDVVADGGTALVVVAAAKVALFILLGLIVS